MTERFKVIAAVYILFWRGEEVLLLQRKNTGFADGMYSLVAGHLDGNEPATQAAIREAKEEAGVTIALEDLEFASVMHRISPDRESVDFFYICRKWQGEITNAEPDKCGELKFYKRSALPENTIPYIREAIQASGTDKKYLENGWR